MKTSKAARAFDSRLIRFFRRVEEPVARGSIFLVYFWFGALKALGLSPALGMVRDLHATTIPFVPFDAFYFVFALFEVAIGLFALVRGTERLLILMVLAHLVTTILPLFFLVGGVWVGFLVPTLAGQYIVKNALIAAVAVGIAARLHPLGR